MKTNILIRLRYNAKSCKPDEEWAEDIQSKFYEINSAEFSKIRVLNNMIRAEAEIGDYEEFCDHIAEILNEECRVLIYIEGEYGLYLSKSRFEGFRQDLYAKGYPTLHCGIIIEKTHCRMPINDVHLKDFFINGMQCINVNVKTYKKGWKVYFDKSSILYEDFINTLCDTLNIWGFMLYLDQNDSSFRDWFEYEYVVVEAKRDYADDESAIMSSLANGEGYRFGYD